MFQNNGFSSKKIAIITNNIECERTVQYFGKLEKYFILNNCEITETFENADLVVICACGYHKVMLDKVLNAFKKLGKMNFSDSNIILMGCLPKTFEEEIKNNFSGHIIEFNREDKLDNIIDAQIRFEEVQESNLFKIREQDSNDSTNNMFYIKISDGCLGNCTYCVIKKARGPLISIDKDIIMKQYKNAIQNGYKKIYLMAEDTFAYGTDTGSSIIELLNEMLAYNDDIELYFGGLHIRWLQKHADNILELCRRGIIKKLDIGLQYVTDKLLKRMGRGDRFAEAYNIVSNIKAECPDIYISTDIIVGFPGESEDDFNELLDFFRKDKCFNSVKHHGYSDNKGAPSFKLDGKVDQLSIAQRWMKLKDVLGERSMYNIANGPDKQGVAFQKTFEEDMFFCKNSYIDI